MTAPRKPPRARGMLVSPDLRISEREVVFAPPPKRERSEGSIQNEAMAAVVRITGVRVLRNNTGVLKDSRGIPVRFGLGNGSPDLIGFISYGGTEGRTAMLLEKLGLPPVCFTFGLEMKQPGKHARPDQVGWHEAFARRGLRTYVCHSSEEAVTATLEECARFDAMMRVLT